MVSNVRAVTNILPQPNQVIKIMERSELSLVGPIGDAHPFLDSHTNTTLSTFQNTPLRIIKSIIGIIVKLEQKKKVKFSLMEPERIRSVALASLVDLSKIENGTAYKIRPISLDELATRAAQFFSMIDQREALKNALKKYLCSKIKEVSPPSTPFFRIP